MVSLTEEQFRVLLERVGNLGAASTTPPHPPPGMSGGRKELDPKYMRVLEFDGAASKWSDWAFGFRRAVRSSSLAAFKIMEAVEKETSDFVESELDAMGVADGVDTDKLSGELYDQAKEDQQTSGQRATANGEARDGTDRRRGLV